MTDVVVDGIRYVPETPPKPEKCEVCEDARTVWLRAKTIVDTDARSIPFSGLFGSRERNNHDGSYIPCPKCRRVV